MKTAKELIKNMQSVCRRCNHISVDFDIKRYVCQKHDIVVTGILLNCDDIEII